MAVGFCQDDAEPGALASAAITTAASELAAGLEVR